MNSLHYRHVGYVRDLDQSPVAGEGERTLLQTTLTLYDEALNGHSYETERNPYPMTRARQQEIITQYLPESELIVATPASAPRHALGFVTFHTVALERSTALFIDGAAVHEREQRKSIGTTLFERTEEIARARSIGAMMLRSVAHSTAFYEKIGFIRESNHHQPVFTKILDPIEP